MARQIATDFVTIAGKLGDARDLIHILDEITNQEGYKKIGAWATKRLDCHRVLFQV